MVYAAALLHFLLLGVLVATAWANRKGARLFPSCLPLAAAVGAVQPTLVDFWSIGALLCLVAADRQASTREFGRAIFSVAILWLVSLAVFGVSGVAGFDARLQSVVVGLGALLAATPVPSRVLHFFGRRWPLAALLAFVFAVLPAVPGLGAGEGNVLRVRIAGLGFQPGELAVLFAICATSGIMSAGSASAIRGRYGRVAKLRVPALVDLLPIFAIWFAMIGVVFVTDDLGTAAVTWVAITSAAAGVVKTRWAAGVVPVGVATSMTLAPLVSPLAELRWQMWLSPWTQETGADASHLARSLSAAIDGGLFGRGTTAAGLGIVPQIARDGAFTGVIATFGLVGGVALIFVLATFVGAWLNSTKVAEDELTSGLRSGILGYLCALTALSTLGSIGVVPWTGVPVPVLARAGTIGVLVIGLASEMNRSQEAPTRSASNGVQRLPLALSVGLGVVIVANSIVGAPQLFARDREAWLTRSVSTFAGYDRHGNAAGIEYESLGEAVENEKPGRPATAFGIRYLVDGGPPTLTVDRGLHDSLSVAFHELGQPFSVIALDPSTGDIMATVGSEQMSPLSTELAPGSIYKLVVATSILEASPETADDWVVEQSGGFALDGISLAGTTCGNSLAEAIAKSCNAPFAAYAFENPSDLAATAEHFGFTSGRQPGDISPVVTNGNLPLNASVGVHPAPESLADFERALLGIGQFNTLMTPLGVAVVTSAIANGGFLVSPGFLQQAEEPPRVMDTATAAGLLSAMNGAWENGTASAVTRPSHYRVLGAKTGTAEADEAPERAWCTIVAEVGDQRIVLSAVVVGGRTGASTCETLVGAVDEYAS